MGGGAMPEQGGGGKHKKKTLDAVINVVPAIDLLSCCISFLLYTAVWTQIARLQVQQMGTADAPPQEQKTITVTLTMTERSLVLTTSANGGTTVDIPCVGARAEDGRPRYDFKGLIEKLKTLKTEHPEQSAITVAAEDGVQYVDLVRAIDICAGIGLKDVSVTAAG